jgi:hypothetical protein
LVESRCDGGWSAPRTRSALPWRRNSVASAALANNASLDPSTAATPHRVGSFINVVGCGTRPSSRDPTKPPPRDRVAHLAAQGLIAKPVTELQKRQRQVDLHRHRWRTHRGSKNGTNGAKNAGSSSSASIRASSSDSRSTSSGNTASHKFASGARVRNIASFSLLIGTARPISGSTNGDRRRRADRPPRSQAQRSATF